MAALWRLANPKIASRNRRGAAGQRARRASERAVRRAAVAFGRWAAKHGWSLAQAAAALAMAPRTLTRWQQAWQRRWLRPQPRGRPCRRSSRAERNRLLALLGLLGPHAGLPTLMALCPKMARREIQDLLRRYRRVCKRRQRVLLRVLHWQRAGAVWAADFAEPPGPVDGGYDRLLAVRDLASGMQLAWLPVADESARTAVDMLVTLFRQHGPPLVLKSDNGSAFISDRMQHLLDDWQVWHLRSPPDLPEYNGACEAGIGSMKTRTHHQACQGGRPGAWTCDDAEAARMQANETARPWGHRGPTPTQAWARRRPLSSAERATFATTVTQMERDERTARGLPAAAALLTSEQAAVDRAALARALVATRHLLFTNEQVPLSRKG